MGSGRYDTLSYTVADFPPSFSGFKTTSLMSVFPRHQFVVWALLPPPWFPS